MLVEQRGEEQVCRPAEELAQLDAICEKLIVSCKDAGINGKKKGRKHHRKGHKHSRRMR